MGKETKRGKNPKSLANLKPIAKGEVRNPKGVNGSTLVNEIYNQIMAEPEVQGDLKNTIRKMVRDPRYALAVAREVREATHDENAAAKEAHVYLIVDDDKRVENARRISGNVEIGDEPDNKPSGSKR